MSCFLISSDVTLRVLQFVTFRERVLLATVSKSLEKLSRELRSVSLYGAHMIATPMIIKWLVKCPHLRYIRLHGAGEEVATTDLKELFRNCKHLKCVSLQHNRKLNKSFVEDLCTGSSVGITELSLWNTGVDLEPPKCLRKMDFLKIIKSFPSLQKLDIRGQISVDDEVLSFAGENLPNLQTIALAGTNITGRGISSLIKLSPQLQEIGCFAAEDFSSGSSILSSDNFPGSNSRFSIPEVECGYSSSLQTLHLLQPMQNLVVDVSQFPNLRKLSLQDCRLFGGKVKIDWGFIGSSLITELHVAQLEPYSEHFTSAIESMGRQLKYLVLGSCNSLSFCNALTQCVELEQLHISSPSGDILKVVGRLPKLFYLKINALNPRELKTFSLSKSVDPPIVKHSSGITIVPENTAGNTPPRVISNEYFQKLSHFAISLEKEALSWTAEFLPDFIRMMPMLVGFFLYSHQFTDTFGVVSALPVDRMEVLCLGIITTPSLKSLFDLIGKMVRLRRLYIEQRLLLTSHLLLKQAVSGLQNLTVFGPEKSSLFAADNGPGAVFQSWTTVGGGKYKSHDSRGYQTSQILKPFDKFTSIISDPYEHCVELA